MSAQLPFPSTAVNPPALCDGIVAGSRKHKQAFSLNDPDNIEFQHLAVQAAKKKAWLSKVVSSDKEKMNERPLPKPNHQPSKTT